MAKKARWRNTLISSGPFKGNSGSEPPNKKSAEERRKRILSYIFGESDFPIEDLLPLRQELKLKKSKYLLSIAKKQKKKAKTDPYTVDVSNHTNEQGEQVQGPQDEIRTAEDIPRLNHSDTHLFHNAIVNSYYKRQIRSEADLVLQHSTRENSVYPSAEQLLGMAISVSNSGKGLNKDKKDQGKEKILGQKKKKQHVKHFDSSNLKMESKLKSQKPTKQVQSIDKNSQVLEQKMEELKKLLDLKNLEIRKLNLKVLTTTNKELEDSRKVVKSLKAELLNRSNTIKALNEQNKEMLQLKSKLERQRAETLNIETLRQNYQQKLETVAISKNREIQSLKNELRKLYKTQSDSAIHKRQLEKNYKELEGFLLKVKRSFEMLLTTMKNEKQPYVLQTTPHEITSHVGHSTPKVMRVKGLPLSNKNQNQQQFNNFMMPQYLADITQDRGGSLHIYLKQFNALADKNFNRILENHKKWYKDIGGDQSTENTVFPYWYNSNNWPSWTEPASPQTPNRNFAYSNVKELTFPLQICPKTHPDWPTYCQCHFNSESAAQTFTPAQQQTLPEHTGQYCTRTHPDWFALCQTHLHSDNLEKPLTPTQEQELKEIQFTLQNLDDEGRIKPVTPETCNQPSIENRYKCMLQRLDKKDCDSCEPSEHKNEMALESSNPNEFKPQLHRTFTLQYRYSQNCVNPNTNQFENQPIQINGLNKVVTSNQTKNETYYVPHKNEMKLQFKDSPRRTKPPLPSDNKTQLQGMLRPIHSASQHVDSKGGANQYQMLTYGTPFSNTFTSQHLDDKGRSGLPTPDRVSKQGDLISGSYKNNLSSDCLKVNSKEIGTQREQEQKKCVRYQDPSQSLNYGSHACPELPNHKYPLSSQCASQKDKVGNELDNENPSPAPKKKPFYMKYSRLANSKQPWNFCSRDDQVRQNYENEITSKNSVGHTVKTQEIHLHDLPSDDLKKRPTHIPQLETLTSDTQITSYAEPSAIKQDPQRVVSKDHYIGKPSIQNMFHGTIRAPVKTIPLVDSRKVVKALYSDIYDPFRTAAMKVAKGFKNNVLTKSEKLQAQPQILLKPSTEDVDINFEILDPVKLTEQLCGIRINVSQDAKPNKNPKHHVLKPVRSDEVAVNLLLLKKLNEKVKEKDVSEKTPKVNRQTIVMTSQEPNVKKDSNIKLSKVKLKEIKEQSPILTSKLQKPELDENNEIETKVKQEQIEREIYISTVPSNEIDQAEKETSVSSTTSQQRTERDPSISTGSSPIPDFHKIDDFAITPSRVKQEQTSELHISNTINKAEMTTTKLENPILHPQTLNVNSVDHIAISPSKLNTEQTGDTFILPKHNSSSETPQPPKLVTRQKLRQEHTTREVPVLPDARQAANFNKLNDTLVTPSKTEQEQFKESPTSNVTDNTKITNLNVDETVNAKVNNMTPIKPVHNTPVEKSDTTSIPLEKNVVLQRIQTKNFKDIKEADTNLSINENKFNNTKKIIQKMETKVDPTKDFKRLDNTVIYKEKKQTERNQNKELQTNLPLSVLLQRLREKNRMKNYKEFLNSLDKSCVVAKTSPLSSSGSPPSPTVSQKPDGSFTKCPLPDSPDSSPR